MIKVLNNNKILVVSHIADIDGMGSIILAKRFFEDFDYMLFETDEVYKMFLEDLSNYENIYVCDLSFGDKGIEYLLNHKEIADKIKHFDHHESELVNNKYSFYNEVIELDGRLTCGTELFYRYLVSIDKDNLINNDFFKEFVEGVRNQDTWDFKNTGNTLGNELATLHGILGAEAYIEVISNIEVKEHFYFPTMYKNLIINEDKKKEDYVTKCNDKLFRICNVHGYKVAVVICEEYRSYVGNYLCDHNDVDFAMIINFYRGHVSLRCVRDDIDLGKIASSFTKNGGGHKKAAAFCIDNESMEEVKKIINDYLDNLKI